MIEKFNNEMIIYYKNTNYNKIYKRVITKLRNGKFSVSTYYKKKGINRIYVSRINFKWNDKSIMNYLENSKLNKILYRGKEHVICEEYYLCEMIDILIVDTYNENNIRKILEN